MPSTDLILPESEQIDWSSIFGREAPHVLEIGFGMGTSLLEMAIAQPQVDFIGLEMHRPGVGALAADALKAGVTNLRLMVQDAVKVCEQLCPENSVDVIQVFFPDPWPKRRHHKRRLIQKDFVNSLQRVCKENGLLHIATDWQPYAKHVQNVMQGMSNWQRSEGEYCK